MPRAKTMAELGQQIDAASGAPSETETPGIMPPAGIPAKVRTQIEYQTRVDPGAEEATSSRLRSLYGRELEDLAAEEGERLAPVDPLSDFLETWANYSGYNCMVLRLPDPSTRRMVGQTYNRPHFGQPEQLGAITFDPNPINFVGSLQVVNQNSGGCFQLWLVDQYGQRIPDAVLHTIAIADPPRDQRLQVYGQQSAPPPQIQTPRPHEETEEEKEMKEFRRAMIRSAMDRLMNPPALAPAAPGAGLSGEQQAALFLFQQTDFLGSLFSKMKEMSAMPAVADAAIKDTWKDRAIDAAVGLAQNNPAIVERLSGTLERIIARILPDPGPQAPIFQPPPPYLPPPPPTQFTPPPAPPLANVGVPDGLPGSPGNEGEDEEEDPEIMDILDSFISLLNSRKPITKDDPVFQELQRAYPIKFRMAVRLIASQPHEEIVAWVMLQSPLYESLLTSEVTGEFLRGRIKELQTVFQQAIAAKPVEAPAPDSAPETE